MNKYFSGGQFKWLSTDEINKFNLNSISENSSDGYILGVDLQYPDELHDLRNDYTLAPEKLETGYNMLPSFCNGISNMVVSINYFQIWVIKTNVLFTIETCNYFIVRDKIG